MALYQYSRTSKAPSILLAGPLRGRGSGLPEAKGRGAAWGYGRPGPLTASDHGGLGTYGPRAGPESRGHGALGAAGSARSDWDRGRGLPGVEAVDAGRPQSLGGRRGG